MLQDKNVYLGKNRTPTQRPVIRRSTPTLGQQSFKLEYIVNGKQYSEGVATSEYISVPKRTLKNTVMKVVASPERKRHPHPLWGGMPETLIAWLAYHPLFPYYYYYYFANRNPLFCFR